MPRSFFLAGALLASAVFSDRAAAQQHLKSLEFGIAVDTIASGLDHPWGLAFLSDGRMLVTERAGRLRIVTLDGKVSPSLAGTPHVTVGEGGLLDVALDPRFPENRFVYLSYSEPRGDGAATAVGRGQLDPAATALENFQVIFRQQPGSISGDHHFGSRLVFTPDGELFVSTGDLFNMGLAQDLANHLGKLIRINPDGSAPPDNPFVKHEGARPEIWSYGHRNVQGLAIHPDTGALWAGEFGPTGGDEINIIKPGRNYGWPLVSWGEHMDGSAIPRPPTRSDLVDAIYHWTPSISFSGMTFYTGAAFPSWRGNLLLAGLASHALIRLTLAGSTVIGEERITMDERIRHVVQGPNGLIYLLTDADQGRILRLSPDG